MLDFGCPAHFMDTLMPRDPIGW